ncbi:universal stress protein [Herbiconiux liangxiaofengii]|uniref:universal stress protein n=1 Tax=Herbiconiux liangxiaofengii TaxID=3342795 RepID=UPI0035B6BCE0
MTGPLIQQPPGSILVGVDGSAPSRAAITWAMRRGGLTGAAVVLAHIISDDLTVPAAYIDPDTRNTGLAFLQVELDYAHLIDRDVSVRTELLQGDPLSRLAAASEHMAMLAIGTHKTGFVQGQVFGSRFIQLAGLAFSPVAFIPNSASHRRKGVVVGVGNAERDEETIRFAAQEADRLNQELIIIHCRPAISDDVGGESPHRWDPVCDAAEVIARRDHPALTIRRRTINRPPAEGLVDGSMSAALLVIGRSHRTTDHPGSVGSVVHDVLLNLAGPTVVVHDTVPRRRTTFAHHAAPIS